MPSADDEGLFEELSKVLGAELLLTAPQTMKIFKRAKGE